MDIESTITALLNCVGLDQDKILTLISNVSKFKDPGQKPFRYS